MAKKSEVVHMHARTKRQVETTDAGDVTCVGFTYVAACGLKVDRVKGDDTVFTDDRDQTTCRACRKERPD